MEFTIFGEKDGKWTPVVKMNSNRRQPNTDTHQLATEGVIEGRPVADRDPVEFDADARRGRQPSS